MNYDDEYDFQFVSADYDVDYTERETVIKSITYSFWTLNGPSTASGVASADYDLVATTLIADEITFPVLSTGEPSEDVTYEVTFYMYDGYHTIDEVKTYSIAVTYLKPNTKPTILKKYIGTYIVGTEE